MKLTQLTPAQQLAETLRQKEEQVERLKVALTETEAERDRLSRSRRRLVQAFRVAKQGKDVAEGLNVACGLAIERLKKRAEVAEADARALVELFRCGEYYTATAYNTFEKHGAKYLEARYE